ncbi:MAG: biopolymer transporter ExbD [Deltaproteobacteria bacterium]|nr:biopolymer transporter ExbD [Deltaproteobacteria bacterium]
MDSAEENEGLITGINVTPMVDVMLVLLIIFMVTATYITQKAIEVQLPEASTGKDVKVTTLAVVVAPDGTLVLNGKAATMDDIRLRVPALLKENPEVQAVVDGDKKVPYGRVMEVIDTLRSLGVKKFAASVEHKVEKPE